MGQLPDPLQHRQADHDILELILRRWSPRAMTGEPVSESQLMQLFEAARWAPSTYNEQEWRFLYAHRETSDWSRFLELLVLPNQAWCQHAGVLIVTLSRKTFVRNENPNPVHSLDTGMAVQNLHLQATAMDLVAHSMSGFDREKARQELKVPEEFAIECMTAVGHPGDPANLPKELQEREIPSGRKPIREIAAVGQFAFK